jgi:hypothetical protein
VIDYVDVLGVLLVLVVLFGAGVLVLERDYR